MSDRVAHHEHGADRADGRPGEVYHRPQTLFVADFVGASNRFARAPCWSVLGEGRYRADLGAARDARDRRRGVARAAVGDQAVAIVRPEAMRTADGVGDAGASDGTVTDVAYLGPQVQYTVDAGGLGHRRHAVSRRGRRSAAQRRRPAVSLAARSAWLVARTWAGRRRPMTFSLVARCPRTGQLGAAVATADIAVGARVPHAGAGVGAVLTQHRTDPRLGPRGLELLRSGCDALATVAALVASTASADWRQLAAVDAAGAPPPSPATRVEQPFCRGARRRVASRSGTSSLARASAGDGGRLPRTLPASRSPSGSCPRSKPASPPAVSARRCGRRRCWSPATSRSRWSTSASTTTTAGRPRCEHCGRPIGRAWTSSSTAPSTPTAPWRRHEPAGTVRRVEPLPGGGDRPRWIRSWMVAAPVGCGCPRTRRRPVPAMLEYLPYRKGDVTAVGRRRAPSVLRRPRLRRRARRHPRQRRLRGRARRRVQPQEQEDALEVLRWIAAQAVVHRVDRHDGHLLGRLQQPAGGRPAAAGAEGDHHRLLDRRSLRRRRALHGRLGAGLLHVCRGHR